MFASRPDEPWIKVARRQHGVISTSQLLACGQTRSTVRILVERGHLVRTERGIYRAGAAPASYEAALWTAVLATGGIVAGSTAAHVWGMVADWSGPITVAISEGRAVAAPRGVQVVRSNRRSARQTTHNGLPIATRRDAALDHMAGLGRSEATKFADRAIQCQWLTLRDIERRLESPRRGNSVLRKVLATLVRGAEAESERVLHGLLRESGLDGWKANVPIRLPDGRVVRPDVIFDKLRIAIEADGFRYHSRDARFQADRTKQNALVLMGWTVLRFTWEDLMERPDHVMDQILAAVAAAA